MVDWVLSPRLSFSTNKFSTCEHLKVCIYSFWTNFIIIIGNKWTFHRQTEIIRGKREEVIIAWGFKHLFYTDWGPMGFECYRATISIRSALSGPHPSKLGTTYFAPRVFGKWGPPILSLRTDVCMAQQKLSKQNEGFFVSCNWLSQICFGHLTSCWNHCGELFPKNPPKNWFWDDPKTDVLTVRMK